MQKTASGKKQAITSAAPVRDAQAFPAEHVLQGILENMPNGVAYCRMLFQDGVPQDFIYLYTNRAFHEQTGLSPLCGERASEVIPGIRSADPQLFEICGRVAAGGKPEKFEIFLVSLQAWFAVHASSPAPGHFVAVFDAITRHEQLGKALHLQAPAPPKESRLGRLVSVHGGAGVSHDITEQQAAEEKLWASEERYRRLHESMLDAFALVDLAGNFQETNQAFQDLVGYSADELAQMTFYDLTPAKWHEMLVRIVAEQILVVGDSEVFAKEYIRKDGTVFPVELRGFLIRDRHGEPEAMWAIVRDVSERKKNEERMQLAQQIFDNANEAIFVSDLQGNLLEVNAEACRLAKYTHEEMLRLRNVDIVAPEETSRIAPELARCDAGTVTEQRWLLRCSDGSTVPLDLVAQRLPGDRYLAIGRDLTEREKVLRQLAQARDEAEQANRAKSRFLAAASHDLRQPILAIELFQDALGKTRLDPEQKRIADYLAHAAESLSGILTELLEISRFDTGAVQACPGPLPAAEVFHRIDAEFSPLARIKGLRLKFFFPQKGLVLFTDQKMLLNLLRNLIDNAFKYIETGGVLVALRSRGDHALVQVWDTGIGIAPEHIEAIFEEYFQVGNPQRDRGKGLGLGLSIVKRLAKVLGCPVSCRSQPGKGSVFEFRVPLVAESAT